MVIVFQLLGYVLSGPAPHMCTHWLYPFFHLTLPPLHVVRRFSVPAPCAEGFVCGFAFFCFFCLIFYTESHCCHVDHFFVVINDNLHAVRIFLCWHEELIPLSVNWMLMVEYLHIYSTTKYLPRRTASLRPLQNSDSITKFDLLHHFLASSCTTLPSLDVMITTTPQRR